MKRLKTLFVKDFRSIDGEVSVSLDAPIVLIHGPNGAGKTSLLSAIELALTGAVPSLSRAEPDYLAYLPHKDRPFGQVRLEMSDSTGNIHASEIKVTSSSVTGNAILDGPDATFFSERSYLAQSALGRLLELYQHTEKKSDSSLTRFVKELLGLDRMEAIIGGLHSAGHISRLKGPVPAYGSTRDEISLREQNLASLEQRKSVVTFRVRDLHEQLGKWLQEVDPALTSKVGDLTELAPILRANPENATLLELAKARREIEVSATAWVNASTAPEATERARIEAENQTCRTAFDRWVASHGERVEALFARAVSLFADSALSTDSTYAERAGSFVLRTEADLARIQKTLNANELALKNRDDLTRQTAEAGTRLARLDQEISLAVATNESVAKALSDLSVHIVGEICPICDRDFSETGTSSLAAHVTAKVSRMIEHAGRLQALSRDRASTATAIAQLERQLQAATAQLISDSDLGILKARAANLTELTKQFNDDVPQMREGDRLRQNAAHAAQITLRVQQLDQSTLAARSSLELMGREFGLTVNDSMSTGDVLQLVRSTAVKREQTVTNRQTARRAANATLDLIVSTELELTSLQTEHRTVENALNIARENKHEADKIIDVAKELVKQTREARGRIVRRVFSSELNSVWRDLFVRLAPEEPFIPAFSIPDVAGAEIEAQLETHHRRGGKGGNPRAMLSAGNLNTAALTLFLALHLSVRDKLPWLVIDDPVQSMDEVHIAQFAALLRTLAKQMNRQVIIAVHERSLFDYLALELSPAFDGDRLNIIELGRNAIGQTTSRWDPKTYVTDRAIAA